MEYLPSGKEVYYTAASFAGTDERTKIVNHNKGNNHPPFVISDMISEKIDTRTYRVWCESIDEGLRKISNGNISEQP